MNILDKLPFIKWRPKNFFHWILLNLAAMLIVAVILIFLIFGFLNIWTHHGSTIEVPEVKGLSYNEAFSKLDDDSFKIEIIDSIFDSSLPRGWVIEQNPKHGAIVKKGRTIYLTINAFSDKTVVIPSLIDVSLRQAQSILEGLGIHNITVRYVFSEYKDLVMGVKSNGVPVKPGTRLPVTASITLEVGEGYDFTEMYSLDEYGDSDSMEPEAVEEEPLEEEPEIIYEDEYDDDFGDGTDFD